MCQEWIRADAGCTMAGHAGPVRVAVGSTARLSSTATHLYAGSGRLPAGCPWACVDGCRCWCGSWWRRWPLAGHPWGRLRAGRLRRCDPGGERLSGTPARRCQCGAESDLVCSDTGRNGSRLTQLAGSVGWTCATLECAFATPSRSRIGYAGGTHPRWLRASACRRSPRGWRRRHSWKPGQPASRRPRPVRRAVRDVSWALACRNPSPTPAAGWWG